ncbi:uncharacterized protein [Arachis hypogaea]|uniref:uncharacterized protein n=1 Tax=Arachis hypogaea TaxID=3818 RepID=UPI003B226964
MNSGTVHPPLDQNSPYFLHPAESPSNPLIFLRLNSQNYTNWSRSISLVLESENKISFIDGSLPRLEVTDPMYATWGRCNTYVLSWLHGDLNHVSELYEELYSAKQDYIARFLRGLNDQFATTKTQIMLLKSLPDMDTVFAMLTQQERQLNLSVDTPDSRILYAANSGHNSTRGRGRDRGV